jgi:hypothetical protein
VPTPKPSAAAPWRRLAPQSDPVALRQRLWPMIDMLRRAQQADEPVVWGV